ncbi:MAG TPA: RNA-binding protein [Candidatus Thermoplasmatota archaeon]
MFRNRYPIRDKEAKEVADALSRTFGATFGWEGRRVERGDAQGFTVFLVDHVPMAFLDGEAVLPTVRGLLAFGAKERYVTVDKGAIGFVIKGADVMAPGIVDADPNIAPGDVVWVREESHFQPLAVGRALMSGPEMAASAKGKAVKTLHHLRDRLWELTQEE